MKLLCYILFVIFSSIYYFVICQDIPSPRCEQTSLLVGTRLYFFGGETSIGESNEVWYLDLSSSFNISTPLWHSDVVMPVGYNLGTSCLSPIDNSTVFLVGGRTWIANTFDYSYTSPVHKFNSKTSQWTPLNINNFNSSFTTRNEIQVVIDNNGKIFIFGGRNYNNSTKYFYNDMNILDITTMTWSTLIQSQSPLTHTRYSATLLLNGLIVYIGGESGSSLNISFTDMAQSVNGSTIASRPMMEIYGGSTIDSFGNDVNIFSDIAVLNTNSWVWFVPNVSGTSSVSVLNLYANKIYILDIQNYTWVTTFNVPTPQSNGNSSTDQANNNSSYLYVGIGIGAGVIISAVVLFIIGFFIYKNRHNEEFIATPGTS
ncbi:galactose oxidase [Gigaspora margarita]|uniref:Galactose oxidase n=1 Tax=Gigaspora margarita TaxID=4874 RepID=A0A8H4ER71_GIGMA|nr:galactose oxidase [Gigaspora margarita]